MFGNCIELLQFERSTADAESGWHPVDLQQTRPKRFSSTFLIQIANVWNALSVSTTIPANYNLGAFKRRVKVVFLASALQTRTLHCFPYGMIVVKCKPSLTLASKCKTLKKIINLGKFQCIPKKNRIA